MRSGWLLFKFFCFSLAVSGGAVNIYGATPQLDTVDTPTAATMYRGGYDLSVWGYENGGIFSRSLIGLHDNIFIGVSFDIQHVIGNETPVFNIPGVAARVKFTDGFGNFPLLIAAGYDAFYPDATLNLASDSIHSRLVYGPYIVFTKPVFMAGSEQHIHWGYRLPIQPYYSLEDSSIFLAFDFPIGVFIPMFEVEKIFFSTSRFNEIQCNFGFRFNLYETFAIELGFIMGIKTPSSRILTFNFSGSF